MEESGKGIGGGGGGGRGGGSRGRKGWRREKDGGKGAWELGRP